jgi:hypothetical protein
MVDARHVFRGTQVMATSPVTKQVGRLLRVRTEAMDPHVTKIPIAHRHPALNSKCPIGNPKTIQKETNQAATVVVPKATVLTV